MPERLFLNSYFIIEGKAFTKDGPFNLEGAVPVLVFSKGGRRSEVYGAVVDAQLGLFNITVKPSDLEGLGPGTASYELLIREPWGDYVFEQGQIDLVPRI